MACNLPIVSVPVGDVENMLAGVDGTAIADRDPTLVGSALIELLDTCDRSAGRHALLERGLSLECVAERLVSIYAEVLAAAAVDQVPGRAASSTLYPPFTVRRRQ